MLKIEFCDLEVQNAIYMVACKYEGFNMDILDGIDVDELNVKEYFWSRVEYNHEVGYGLEKAISDYLLMQGEFAIGSGRYGYLIDAMECEVFDIKHWGD